VLKLVSIITVKLDVEITLSDSWAFQMNLELHYFENLCTDYAVIYLNMSTFNNNNNNNLF
jgi:hypothetical protein